MIRGITLTSIGLNKASGPPFTHTATLAVKLGSMPNFTTPSAATSRRRLLVHHHAHGSSAGSSTAAAADTFGVITAAAAGAAEDVVAEPGGLAMVSALPGLTRSEAARDMLVHAELEEGGDEGGMQRLQQRQQEQEQQEPEHYR